jgi:hypothetical protein
MPGTSNRRLTGPGSPTTASARSSRPSMARVGSLVAEEGVGDDVLYVVNQPLAGRNGLQGGFVLS